MEEEKGHIHQGAVGAHACVHGHGTPDSSVTIHLPKSGGQQSKERRRKNQIWYHVGEHVARQRTRTTLSYTVSKKRLRCRTQLKGPNVARGHLRKRCQSSAKSRAPDKSLSCFTKQFAFHMARKGTKTLNPILTREPSLINHVERRKKKKNPTQKQLS